MRSYFKRRLRTFNTARKFKLSLKPEELNTKVFPSNYISTSKYSLITFFPKSLLLQFKRYANIYFLIIAILQSIAIISPLNPFTALAPFVFVIGLSMLREGYEDIQRHKSDIEINAYKTKVLMTDINNNSINAEITWADIEVGSILLIHQDEQFPSDLIILASSLEDGNCFIQTSSLDGEKNLKPKTAIKETLNFFSMKNIENSSEIKTIELNAQSPDQNLYSFEGTLMINQEKYFLGPKQLLLRGSQLRNTKWIIGAVVYTGMDTKIMRNSENSKQKSSEIEKKTNTLIIYLLFIQLICSTICALMNLSFNLIQLPNIPYINIEYSPVLEGFITFWSYFLLLNTMLPISLIVSLEFVKVFQAYFISNDDLMFVKENQRYCKVMSASINEELGQVEYVFSDKTGTLTCNKMEFKIAVIGDDAFGETQLYSEQGYKAIKKMNKSMTKNFESVFTFESSKLRNILSACQITQINDNNQFIEKDNIHALAHEFWQILACCHECIIQEDEITNQLLYQGQSPDEITLVDAASHMDYKFLGVAQNKIHLEIRKTPKFIDLHFLFEFNSNRKRMSIIIKDGNSYKLYIKGADNVIKSRLNTNIDQPYLQTVEKKIDKFSKLGLRTLLIAFKELTSKEFEEISSKAQALADVQDRDQEMARLAEEIETDLFLIGATAIEDKLQYGVPATINDLLKANIKVWMLTGDKLETAENIARSCKLIQENMTLMTFADKTQEGTSKKMIENLEILELCKRQGRKISLLLDGESLVYLQTSSSLIQQFVALTKDCDSVVCCRVNPKQKAEVVRLIKNNLKKITLAIGDGANDVNMIQEAHIGIGIYGKEGMRAVQASDFAIGEFQCLWRLLLIHGRWCYRRTAEMIIYFFYKNMIFTIPHFFFSFLCGSSAQTIFDDWYISFYNLFFTALPLIVRAVFEQDVDYKIRIFDDKLNCTNDSQINKPRKKKAPFTVIEDQYLKDQIPKLYYVGQLKTVFTTLRFLGWVLWAIFQSLILFGLNLLVFNYVILKETGINSDLWSFSITYFTTIILLVDLKLALNTTFWTCLNWLAFIPLSVLLYFAYFLVSNYLSTTWAYLTPIMLLTVFDFYATVLLGLLTFFLADYIIYVVPNLVFNSSINSLIEYSKKKRGVYQNLNNTTKNDNKDNQFIQEKDNSLLKSVKNDDIDEKNVGDIELSLQQHFSIEKPENSITLQDVKI